MMDFVPEQYVPASKFNIKRLLACSDIELPDIYNDLVLYDVHWDGRYKQNFIRHRTKLAIKFEELRARFPDPMSYMGKIVWRMYQRIDNENNPRGIMQEALRSKLA